MYKNGLLFEEEYVKELKKEFFMVDSDPGIGERLFFDNSGGSLRLKSCEHYSKFVSYLSELLINFN